VGVFLKKGGISMSHRHKNLFDEWNEQLDSIAWIRVSLLSFFAGAIAVALIALAIFKFRFLTK
jgi:hypothetical protein